MELFDIAQSNSEHSRHWFFKADIHIDGVSQPHSLFDLVKVEPCAGALALMSAV